MNYLNRALKGIFNFLLVFTGLLIVLFIYQLLAVKHGVLPIMAAGSVNADMLVFSTLATLPIAAIFFWPLFDQIWPGAYLAAIRFRGTRYLVDLTRWRAAFIASLLSVGLIEVLL